MRYILLIFVLISSINFAYANEYKCVSSGYSNDTKHNLYIDINYNLSNSSDIYKCTDYWMQGNSINTLGGDDKVYISKNTGSDKLIINLGDGNDSFYHTFHDMQLMNTLIDGGNGYDKIYLKNLNKEKLFINGNCNNKCDIRYNGNYERLLGNITLKNIEEIVLDDGNIKFNNSNTNNIDDNSLNNNTGDNDNIENNDSNINNNDSNIDNNQINLSNYNYLIPAYWWSYDLNKKLENINNAIVIINPSNGDFSRNEDIFNDMLTKVKTNNNLAVGYIYTLYGKRNLNDVKKRIDTWIKEYPGINGFFFDEVSSSKSDLNFYKEIYNYVKLKNKNFIVILNPGTTPDEGYMNISDNIVVYENKCGDYKNYNKPNWLKNYKDYRFSYLGHTCKVSEINNLSINYKNYIQYFTGDGSDGNPWDSFSDYILSESKVIDNNNNNNNNNNNKDKNGYVYSKKNKFNNFLIYYGYPNYINEAYDVNFSSKEKEEKERLKIAVKEFSKFETIIWSSRLPNPEHKAHDFTKKLLKILKGNVTSYGYIALYGGYRGKATLQSVCRDVDEWSEMGVDGIFFDEASFNYYKKGNNNFNDYKLYIKDVYNCAKNKGYKVIFNTGKSEDIINSINLTNDDGFLIEDFYYANGLHKSSYDDRVERNIKMIGKTKAKYFCNATGKEGYSQEQINKIGSYVKDDMFKYCSYRSVQDEYGTDSRPVYAKDDILTTINNNINSKIKIINNKLDRKIENIFLKLRKKSGLYKNYRKNLILLNFRINKIKKKYIDDNSIISILDYFSDKIKKEILKK